MEEPSCEEYCYYVFYFWTDKNNAPGMLNNIDGYPKWFKTKKEAIKWISDNVDNNCNITYCITRTNEWSIKKLKDLYKK